MVKQLNLQKILINKAKLIVSLAVIFYFVIFGLISIWKYFNFGYNAMDLAIINQVFFNSAQGQLFNLSIHPPTYLADHFTPIIFLLLPIYLLFQHPITLLLLQTAALALCAWPIYFIAKKILPLSYAVLVSIIWLVNPFVQNINLFEFHFLPFAIFFILWAFYFYQQKNFGIFIIISLLAMLVREDVALVILMFGLLAMLDKRKFYWSVIPILIGIGYFLTGLKIISLASDLSSYKFFIYYSWLGDTAFDFIKNAFLKPWLVASHLLRFSNLEFLLGIFLPFAFIPLLKPKYLILAAAIYAQLMLGAAGTSGTLLQMHYSALILPALFISFIFGIHQIINQPNFLKKDFLNFFIQEKKLTILIFTITIIYSSLTLGPVAGSLTQLVKQNLVWPETEIKNQMVAKIPPDASVAATYEFMTKLSSRKNLHSFNYIFLGKQQFLAQDYPLPSDTEYLLLDFNDLITYQLQYDQNDFFKEQYSVRRLSWPEMLNGFGLVEVNSTFALYQKNKDDNYQLINTQTDLDQINTQKNVVLDDQIEFLGFNQKTNNNYQFFWRALKKLSQNYQLEISFEKKGKIYTKLYPLAYDLFPTDQWQPNQIIQTNYWLSAGQPVSLKLIEINKGGLDLNGLRSSVNTIDESKILGQAIQLN